MKNISKVAKKKLKYLHNIKYYCSFMKKFS